MKYRIIRVRRRVDGEEIDLSHLFAIPPIEKPPKKPSRFRAFLHHIQSWLAARRKKRAEHAKKRAARPKNVAILAGALCSSTLVLILSGAIILLTLISPYVGAYVSVTVPDLVGQNLENLPEDDRFSYIVHYEYHPDVPSGHVITQSPAAGMTRSLPRDGGLCTMSLVVSRPKEPYVLPTLAGLPSRDAILELRNHSIPYSVRSVYSDAVAPGLVMSSDPIPGTKIDGTTGVTLTISAGSLTVYASTPSLVGLSEMAAQTRLLSAGLIMGNVTYLPDNAPAGQVLSQSVAVGQKVPLGTKIDLVVSSGRTHTDKTVPSLYGLTLAQAQAALRACGLVVGHVSSPSGTVISQSPAPGTPITSSVVSVDLHLG